MERQRDMTAATALFLSFAGFFATCPLMLWDAALFFQISSNADFEAAVVDGMTSAGLVLSVAIGLWSLARGFREFKGRMRVIELCGAVRRFVLLHCPGFSGEHHKR